MRILIANDDGVTAPGIAALYQALGDLGVCTVIAPEQDCSGMSSALTLNRPLSPKVLENGFISVNGTPADCVHLGCHGLLGEAPDVVASGINLGANLGDDLLYSGTLGAALEGRFTGRTAWAFSLTSSSPDNLATAAWFARRLLGAVKQLPESPAVMNVNIPNLPLAQIRGMRLTRPGRRLQSPPPVRVVNPRGQEGYWIAAAGDVDDGGPGTDFHCIVQGFVSVTPLLLDRSVFLESAGLQAWLESLV